MQTQKIPQKFKMHKKLQTKFQDIATINVFDYVPLNSRIFLDSKFRLSLFNQAIKTAGTKRKLAKLLNTNETSVYQWKIGKKRPTLETIFKLTEITNIDKKIILNKIIKCTSYLSNGAISIKEWKIQINKEFSEFLGLLKGDGTVTIDYVGFFNNDLKTIILFYKYLNKFFDIDRDRIELTIRYDSNTKLWKVNKVTKILRNKSFENIKHINEKQRKFKRNEPNIKIRFCSRFLSRFLKNLNKDIYNIILNSKSEVKVGYLKGFFISEGSVFDSRGYRGICISQKDVQELNFIKILLKDIGITNVSKPILSNRSVYQMMITTRKEIEKFRDIIGFGVHKIKVDRLNKIISAYRKDMPYNTSKQIRYEDILTLLKNNKKGFICKDISENLMLKYKYTNRLLKELDKDNKINVDKSFRELRYYI